MQIRNIDGLSATEIKEEVDEGAKFVYYKYTVSLLFVTFNRVSGVYLVYHDESRSRRGLYFTVISALFGWWGFPFGPAYTVESIRTNSRGGIDVTDEIMATVNGRILFEEAERNRKAS